MSVDLSMLFSHISTGCSVTKNWCKRSCLAQHLAKVGSVSKSIFAMPVIDVTIDFSNTAFATAKPAISRRFATFQRCTTLQQHSTTQR
jgi:hypothetical protein